MIMAMTTYNRMPDLISSSVNIDNIEEDDRLRGQTYSTHGTIYPFSSIHHQTTFGIIVREVVKLMYLHEAKKIMCFLGFCAISTIVVLYWCHSTNSMALTAFSFLLIFDILSLLTCLLSVWVQSQQPSSAYSFGYERFEVLAVFSCTMLAQLGAFFILKESIEYLLFPPEIHTGRLLVGTMYGLLVHLSVIYTVKNRAFNHVIDASSSSWLQEHVTDMSESLCSFVPGLSKLLLPRINPFSLIGFGCSLAILVTYFLIDAHQCYIADPWAAIAIAFMTFGTMFPMSSYTGKILLQTTPSHILGQLDKVLREASTLEGVLEFRHEHFWTLSFGTLAVKRGMGVILQEKNVQKLLQTKNIHLILCTKIWNCIISISSHPAGSVQVRVRRDADEQLVLAHVFNRLNNLVHHLTIQIFKDDWSWSASYTSTFSGQTFAGPTGYPSQPRVSSPTHDSSSLLQSPVSQSNRQVPYSLSPVN